MTLCCRIWRRPSGAAGDPSPQTRRDPGRARCVGLLIWPRPGYTPPHRANAGSPPGVALPSSPSTARWCAAPWAGGRLRVDQLHGPRRQLDAALGKPRRSSASCSTSIRPAAKSGRRVRSGRPHPRGGHHQAGLGRGQRHGVLGARAGVRRHACLSRTGGVGSIGVIAMHVDQSEKDAQGRRSLHRRVRGRPQERPQPARADLREAHAFLKTEVDRVYGLFVETVARHADSSDAVRDTEAGLFFGRRRRHRPGRCRRHLRRRARPALAIAFPTPDSGGSRPPRASSQPPDGVFMNDRTDPLPDRPLADPAGSLLTGPSAAATLSVADASRSPRPARWPGAPT